MDGEEILAERLHQLTKREMLVLYSYAVNGATEADLARARGVTRGAVSGMICRALRKLGARENPWRSQGRTRAIG